MEELTKTERL